MYATGLLAPPLYISNTFVLFFDATDWGLLTGSENDSSCHFTPSHTANRGQIFEAMIRVVRNREFGDL